MPVDFSVSRKKVSFPPRPETKGFPRGCPDERERFRDGTFPVPVPVPVPVPPRRRRPAAPAVADRAPGTCRGSPRACTPTRSSGAYSPRAASPTPTSSASPWLPCRRRTRCRASRRRWRVCSPPRDAGEHILIVGDYDCDGATSTAVAVLGLTAFGFAQVEHVVPNRFRDGYGLSPAIVRAAVARHAPDLIVTVDNGVAPRSTVCGRRARGGVDVLVTDHHLPARRVARGGRDRQPQPRRLPLPEPATSPGWA